MVAMDDRALEPELGDAFGQILMRWWRAGGLVGQAFEVIERDDGLIGVGDAARYFTGPSATCLRRRITPTPGTDEVR